jgi:hypothetical protein
MWYSRCRLLSEGEYVLSDVSIKTHSLSLSQTTPEYYINVVLLASERVAQRHLCQQLAQD